VTQGYLSLREVAKNYGSVRAVERVSLDIEKGEFVTFLGPSGSGKTTTLTMVAGFEEPTQGGIFLNGKDLTLLKPWQRNIGMVFQNYALFPHMTVAENIGFPLRMRKMAKAAAEARVAEVLELVSLTGFASRQPRELSGGQQQRVAVARGLVFRPDVLLLDEPLGALDKNLREQMQVELKRIHREVGTTMIYVTHDQTEAMTMSDRIVVFNRGSIEQVGTPLDVYHRPQTRFVGEFVGDSNFFSGRLDDMPGHVLVEGLGRFRISSEPLGALKPGQKVDVMMRPERLRLLEQSAPATENMIEFEVGTIVNYGDSVLLIGTAAEWPIRSRMTSDCLSAVREGARIRTAIAPNDVHVIAPR
jgi:putative spermidine/putrescine transport system ATP-binding protein